MPALMDPQVRLLSSLDFRGLLVLIYFALGSVPMEQARQIGCPLVTNPDGRAEDTCRRLGCANTTSMIPSTTRCGMPPHAGLG